MSLISPMNSTFADLISGSNLLVVIILVGAVDLGGDLERHAAMLRDADGAIDALLRRDAAEEREIARLDGLRRQQLLRQAVMDRAHPVCLRQRPPLRIGDRHHRHRRERVEHRLVLRQIEPAVQRRHERRRLPGEQRERIIVEVEVQEVEIGGAPVDALQHHHVQRVGVAHRAVEPQRPRPRRFELRRRHRIAAGEQRHVVTERDQFLGQPGYHPLGAAIELGRDSLGQRRNLCDVHRTDLVFYCEVPHPATSDNVAAGKNFRSWRELNFSQPMELLRRCDASTSMHGNAGWSDGRVTFRQ